MCHEWSMRYTNPADNSLEVEQLATICTVISRLRDAWSTEFA